MKKVEVKGTIVGNSEKWIYDWLGIEAVCPNDIKNTLNDANGEEIILEINSGGGDVDAGNEMFYLLNSYNGKTVAEISGICASAATFVACGADTVRAIPSTRYMIHNVSASCRGDHSTMEHVAGALKVSDKGIANLYMMKTGLRIEELQDMMEKETYMNAEEAKEKGFIDEIIEMKNKNFKIYNSGGLIIPQDAIEKIRNKIAEEKKQNKNQAEPVEKEDTEKQKRENQLTLLRMRGK